MRSVAWITSIGLLCFALGVQAASPQSASNYRYRWVDASGLAHYSDKLDNQAVARGYDILNAQGMVIEHVRGELSKAERAAAAAKAAQLAATRAADLKQQLHDQQLLQAYPTEQAFREAQQARLQGVQRDIHTTRANIAAQEDSLTGLLDHAAALSRAKQDLPRTLQQHIDKQRQTVLEQRQLLREQQAHAQDLRKQMASNLAYYRQLQDRQGHAGEP